MKTQKTILSPSEFAWFQLGMKSVYDWQIECQEAVGNQEFGGPPVAVAAPNGSGKTSDLVAPLVMCSFGAGRFDLGRVPPPAQWATR